MIGEKAEKEHKHTLADITDYKAGESYDDTELRTLIGEKEHKHTISQIEDYVPYDDTELKTMIDEKLEIITKIIIEKKT